MDTLNTWELDIITTVSDHAACPALDTLAAALAWAGDGGRVFILLTLALMCLKRTRGLGVAMAIALILQAMAVHVALKPLIGRVRPYDFNESLSIIVPHPGGMSFPSGHTAAAFSTAVCLRPLGRPAYGAALAAASLTGLSRCYLLVHYPTDVLAGALVGGLCGLAAAGIWNKMGGRRAPRKGA